MLNDWMFWLSSLHPEELFQLLAGLLLIDAPRYAVSRLLMCLWDIVTASGRWAGGHHPPDQYTHCPSVCIILAGHNEGETIEGTLRSVYNTYPNLQIIVVDDGSLDDMYQRALRFARQHPDVLVLRRPRRGGKSSAMNSALPYSQAEIVVSVDADSELGPAAIWEIVQAFKDPKIGIVSATILARNGWTNLVTWLQAYEYLHSIFIGRIVSERLGTLGIASGAFAAIRRDVLLRVMGWDVGPPEDLDLALRVRKAGFKIAFAPYAACITDVPTTWKGLLRQRLRWDEGAVVRNHLRKHVDLGLPWSNNFRWRDLPLMIDNWFFQFACPWLIVAYFAWIAFNRPANLLYVCTFWYLASLVFELIQVATASFYSRRPWHDLAVCAVFPLMPPYQLLMLSVRIVSNTRELLWRTSFRDNYVPEHVRSATWRW
jgi:cellulose synthase/poly-beta-1,6-N-acetylglucosamine synthase-like glycosyltransferase